MAQALKAQRVSSEELSGVIACMATLNKGAKDASLAAGAHAATDVTGFGLLGHLHHLLLASGLAARISADAVPLFHSVRALAADGVLPGGTKRNLAYVEPHVDWAPTLGASDRLVLCDAQTSGGLLIAVPPEGEGTLLAELEKRGAPARAVIGELLEGAQGRIEVTAR